MKARSYPFRLASSVAHASLEAFPRPPAGLHPLRAAHLGSPPSLHLARPSPTAVTFLAASSAAAAVGAVAAWRYAHPHEAEDGEEPASRVRRLADLVTLVVAAALVLIAVAVRLVARA